MAKKMTPNSRRVYEFLKGNGAGVKFTTKQVQEALGFEKPGSVTGSITGLCRKGYAERFEDVITDENGKEKTIKTFALTEQGAAWDPDAEDSDED